MSGELKARKKKLGRPYKCGGERMADAFSVSLPEFMKAAVLREMALSGESRAAEIRSLILDGLAARAEKRCAEAVGTANAVANQVEGGPTQPWKRPHFASLAASAAAKRGV